MIFLKPLIASDAEALFSLIINRDATDTIAWDGPESLGSFRQNLKEREERVTRGETYLFTIHTHQLATRRSIRSASFSA